MNDNSGGVTNNPNKSGRGGRSRGNNRSWRPYFRRNNNRIGQSSKPTTLPIPQNETAHSEPLLGDTTTVGPTNINPATSVFIDTTVSYPGWNLYFPQEDYKTSTTIVRKVKAFESHFRGNPTVYDVDTAKTKRYFSLPLSVVTADENFLNIWASFSQDLAENPEITLSCASIAMYKLAYERRSQTTQSTSSFAGISTSSVQQVIRARISGYGPTVSLRSLKVNTYGRLISVRGTVIRTSAPELLCTWMAFRCSSCKKEQTVLQPDGVMTTPTSCKDGCRSRSNFIPVLSSPYTRTEAYQVVRLQESMLGDLYEPGRVPKSIDVELTEDLVDFVYPGDDVNVTGISKVKPQDEVKRRDQTNLYKTYITAVSITSSKNTITNRKSEFTEKDMEAFKMISEEPSPFRLLVHSLCPQIYGHELVKAGLLLGLLGGSSLHSTRRSETHVLLVGDPGLGKSQMLQACANVSPRGIFVCGNSSSSAGLTATVRKEKGRGSSLEAGALVLADQGACCIDEFDKMSANHHALLEVMEQQTVSVAKASVLCSLPARTSVLAAANPSGGHYDRSKTISENLKMNPALLSRFDLVFILLDRPNERLDSLLTTHIQKIRSGDKSFLPGSVFLRNNSNNRSTPIESNGEHLQERLQLKPNEQIDRLPAVLMQKYIAFARKNIHPKITSEAAEEIKQFYLELRRERAGIDAIPITTRQLEAIIRLTQARARLELSTEANKQHANDVISIIRYSYDVTGNDGAGDFPTEPMERGASGSASSQTSQIRKFVRLLERRAQALSKTIFDTNELKEIANHARLSMGFTEVIDTLNMQGVLLKKGANFYKFLMD